MVLEVVDGTGENLENEGFACLFGISFMVLGLKKVRNWQKFYLVKKSLKILTHNY